MTMQVGMIAKDGIVLASDTWWSRSPKPGHSGTHHGWDSSKFVINDAKNIAVACARDKITSTRIAEAIVSKMSAAEPAGNREQRIRQVASVAAEGHDVECLIAFAGSDPGLYLFQHVNQGADVISDRIIKFAHTGDSTNAALFWLMRYYQHDKTVLQLMGLASHTVLAAKEFNSALISGLEIVYSDGSEFHRLSPHENNEWVMRSKGWEAQIEELIMGVT
ncbi:hypothetical protein HDF16_003927 [Granulicella aggregans]|uniref:Uncharacterized protein n=1 Tax=Granulicella aggregans TaxID=474949 RepID=A0A7W7ZGI0_9BACT|nr:hypothetical protein [Granulicella aggregans]MBB5059204.1 hypothetical protein [Granulicella aggregans]